MASLSTQCALYQQASRLAGFGAWECDLATERLTWTDGVYDLFGLPIGSRLNRVAVLDTYVDHSRQTLEVARAHALRTGQGFCMDIQIRRPVGGTRWLRLWADVVADGGRPVRLRGAKQDITAETERIERLRQLAEQDALTGLANRAGFDARYKGVADGTIAALALIDLDHLKTINDSFGHAAGDACLRETGLRLARAFAGAAVVARIGGDEFAVLVDAPFQAAALLPLLERARCALARPLFWGGMHLQLSASIGAALAGRSSGPCTLFADADAALYEAKAAGRNTVRLFGQAQGQAALASGA